jgi:hypothetical protein
MPRQQAATAAPVATTTNASTASPEQWLAAASKDAFAVLLGSATSAAVDHPYLAAVGLTRCHERKQVMRRLQKLGDFDGAAASFIDANTAGEAKAPATATAPSTTPPVLAATVQTYFKDSYMFGGKGTVVDVQTTDDGHAVILDQVSQ